MGNTYEQPTPPPLNIYLLHQTANCEPGACDCAVVAAATFEEARNVNPAYAEMVLIDWDAEKIRPRWTLNWVMDPEHIKVKFLGHADSRVSAGTICASFIPN